MRIVIAVQAPSAQATRDIARLLATEIEAALPESLFVRGDTGYIAQREGPNKEILTYVLAYVEA